MRILAVADTHTYHDYLPPLPDAEVFVHAGDLLRRGTLDELREAALWLRRLPYARKLLVAGNHDWCFQRTPREALEILGPDITYLQDSGVSIDGLRFWGSPWQPEYRAWAFNLPRGAPLAERWAMIPGSVDVLITHGPPRGIGDWSGIDEREGCSDLLEAVERTRPLLHLFGHIHESGGFWRIGETAFANVTTCEGERGATLLEVEGGRRAVVELDVPRMPSPGG